jgi:hypothetical protein
VNTISIEETEDERSIVTPDLRLRFRWLGDRWTHFIDIRPGPWQTVAQAIEWSADEPNRVPGPTYQELHLQRDGDDAVALAVGRAGSHHFSASFRVHFRAWRQAHFRKESILQDRSESCVEIDVADRCRSGLDGLEARYKVLAPPVHTFLGDRDDSEAPERWSPKWRPHLVWEANVPKNYDVFLGAWSHGPATRVSILRRDPECWTVRAAPERLGDGGTSRFAYTWGHGRVSVFPRPLDPATAPAWTMPMGDQPPASFRSDL